MERSFGPLSFAIVGLLALAAAAGAIGTLTPQEHIVTSTAFYHQPVDSVWAVVSDVEHSASWRPGVRAIERLPDHEGNPAWSQVGREGSVRIVVIESVPRARLRLDLGDRTQGFGGSWILTLAADSVGTQVRLTEYAFISNPFLRLRVRYFLGYHHVMDRHLEALGRRFGEEVKPTHEG